MNPIQEWLAGTRPYYEGVELYLQHGHDPLLKLLFQENYSEFKNRKLSEMLEVLTADEPPKKDGAQELKKVVDEQADIIDDLLSEKEDLEDENYELRDTNDDLQDENQKLLNKKEQLEKDLATKLATAPKGWPANMDATVKALHDEWLPLFSEKKNLQARIYDIARAGQLDAAKKTEAGTMAHRILDLREACRDVYHKRDHYIAHGKLPEAPLLPGISVNPKDWPTKKLNHQKYLRDRKAELKKLMEQPVDPEQKEAHNAKMERLKKHIQLQEAYVTTYKKLLGDTDAI